MGCDIFVPCLPAVGVGGTYLIARKEFVFNFIVPFQFNGWKYCAAVGPPPPPPQGAVPVQLPPNVDRPDGGAGGLPHGVEGMCPPQRHPPGCPRGMREKAGSGLASPPSPAWRGGGAGWGTVHGPGSLSSPSHFFKIGMAFLGQGNPLQNSIFICFRTKSTDSVRSRVPFTRIAIGMFCLQHTRWQCTTRDISLGDVATNTERSFYSADTSITHVAF